MNTKMFEFSSKADTLAKLSLYPDLNIPPVFSFTVAQWHTDRSKILADVQTFHADSPMVAVRSSCWREDSASSSGAGAFLSLLNVASQKRNEIGSAIEQVIASYGDADDEDQVLIQPMVENPAVTGVIMTRSLVDGSPYYVINYDDESGKTDTVTGGTHAGKTVYVYRQACHEDFVSHRVAAFVKLARRLEEICSTDLIDIEFCLDQDNKLYLLQARPICAPIPLGIPTPPPPRPY